MWLLDGVRACLLPFSLLSESERDDDDDDDDTPPNLP
jgi:hypothetical protein